MRVSFDIPKNTADHRDGPILEALRETRIPARFYQASLSEMYGRVQAVPQTDITPSQVYAYWATVNCRESYGLQASYGILFNHESLRRGETFVTRKITRAVAAIKKGQQKELYLGNLDAKRDWDTRRSLSRGCGACSSNRSPTTTCSPPTRRTPSASFCEQAFAHAGLDWQKHVKYDPRYERPAELDLLIGNPDKARQVLGWEPQTKFSELVKLMVDADIAAAGRHP